MPTRNTTTTSPKSTRSKPVDPANQAETWRNALAGTVVIRRFDHRGDLTRDEVIPSGRTFHISHQERRMNQERAAEGQDIFATGVLVPVRLLEGTEDAAEIASNPNLMSEKDMKLLVGGTLDQLVERMGKVANVTAVERILAIATELDAPYSKVTAINERLKALVPDRFGERSVLG